MQLQLSGVFELTSSQLQVFAFLVWIQLQESNSFWEFQEFSAISANYSYMI